MLKIDFLGAAQTVTGSKYLLSDERHSLMIDCGLFQGPRDLRDRNRLPVDPALRRVEDVILTHAHIDHSGYMPVLVRNGWRGRILCSAATADLCQILLPDSGHLQEKDAQFANKRGYSRHQPAEPLYTEEDARRALEFFSPVAVHTVQHVANGNATVRLDRAGHILGASCATVRWHDRRIVFSGDLGRYNDPIMHPPEQLREADYIVVESTYGNRKHDDADATSMLGDVIERTVGRGGTVVVPTFAVGRAQSLLFHLSKLHAAGRLRSVPVFLDSPMAVNASELFCSHPDDHKLSRAECMATCQIATYVREVSDSKALNANPMPKVILSASGMATGGRVLHHLAHYAPDPRNTILFAGFQAAGTRGAALVAGAREVKIHGDLVPVRAEIVNLSMLSAHADADEIMRWLAGFERPPRRAFITHGEPAGAEALKGRITQELGWDCHIPFLGEQVVLT